jgi:hypothetical protein
VEVSGSDTARIEHLETQMARLLDTIDWQRADYERCLAVQQAAIAEPREHDCPIDPGTPKAS